MVDLKNKVIKLIENLDMNKTEKIYILLKLVHSYNYTCVNLKIKSRINVYNTSLSEIMQNENQLNNVILKEFQSILVNEIYPKFSSITEENINEKNKGEKDIYQQQIEWFTLELLKHYKDELNITYELKSTKLYEMGILFDNDTKEDYARDVQIKLIFNISNFMKDIKRLQITNIEIRYFIFTLIDIMIINLKEYKLNYKTKLNISSDEFINSNDLDVAKMYTILSKYIKILEEDLNFFSNFITKLIDICNDTFQLNIKFEIDTGNDIIEKLKFDGKGGITKC